MLFQFIYEAVSQKYQNLKSETMFGFNTIAHCLHFYLQKKHYTTAHFLPFYLTRHNTTAHNNYFLLFVLKKFIIILFNNVYRL